MTDATSIPYGLLAAFVPRPAKPAFGILDTVVDGEPLAVQQQTLVNKPFCKLLRFARAVELAGPRILLVGPLSGHFAVLMRDMVVALLPDHDVYVTDWIDAREVPVEAGPFAFEDNIAYLLDFLRYLGPGTHVLGLCQSVVPVLAAAALLAEAGDPAAPRSLTLVAGTVDTRVNPTRVDYLLRSRSVGWFERTMMATVPRGNPGAGRRVYPGAVQYVGLMAYLARHLAGHRELHRKLAHDDGADPVTHPFYETYGAVMDLTSEFFLDNLRIVFHEFALPRGQLSWRGLPIRPAAISDVSLMTIEGEHDDIAAPGQTYAAHALCAGIAPGKRVHHLQPGVGHFGTFHGRVWRRDITPRLRTFLRAAD